MAVVDPGPIQLTMAEAKNELTLLKQHGAPLRLVVPWKYGFKSIKSIAKIEFTAEQPRIFWNRITPYEYGFTVNVDPRFRTHVGRKKPNDSSTPPSGARHSFTMAMRNGLRGFKVVKPVQASTFKVPGTPNLKPGTRNYDLSQINRRRAVASKSTFCTRAPCPIKLTRQILP